MVYVLLFNVLFIWWIYNNCGRMYCLYDSMIGLWDSIVYWMNRQ